MKQFLIIPDREHIEECISLAKKYNLGFEYNDFYMPDLLDDENKLTDVILYYQKYALPEYTTLHGAFFDVIPFSMDKRIREIADRRIRQSIEVASKLGVKAVIFHTNYNPLLNSEVYMKSWLQSNTEYWSGILQEFSDMNIYLENMFDAAPDLLEALSEELCKYPNYGVCLDYAHASLSAVAPELWAKRLGKYIKHVHINDNDLFSDLHQAWGDGMMDRVKFYESYKKYIKDATILIETSAMESKIRSLDVLKEEGFL